MILDTHKIVYAVSFMPSFEGAAVGGFDWYEDEDAARRTLVAHLHMDAGGAWAHDYTLRSMLVPKDLTDEQITDLLDTELRDMRELPLPAEWEAIRATGGAHDHNEGSNS